jgi:CheY-like chemotaxis protein
MSLSNVDDNPTPYEHAQNGGVLIVEDDADLREMMAQLLTMEGFVSTAVANGREALEYLRHGGRPHVILLDLMMPVMDGWEFLREQHRETDFAAVPVIILSALDQHRAGNTGNAEYLKKPLDFDRLVQLVRQHCH